MTFTDVLPEDWSYSYIKTLYNAKIINGKTENVFGKSENLTRADLAVILKRISGIINIESKENNGEEFADDSEIPEYAKDAVYEMKALGVINGMGDNSYNPNGLVTRAQASKAVYFLMTLMKGA